MTSATAKRPGSVVRLLMAMFLSVPLTWSQPCQQPEIAVKKIVGLQYPRLARLAVIQGTVELIATISRDGTVTRTRVEYGKAPLTEAAKESLSKWQFNGCTEPRGCDVRIVFSFVLTGSCDARENCPTDFEVDLPGKVKVASKAINAIVN